MVAAICVHGKGSVKAPRPTVRQGRRNPPHTEIISSCDVTRGKGSAHIQITKASLCHVRADAYLNPASSSQPQSLLVLVCVIHAPFEMKAEWIHADFFRCHVGSDCAVILACRFCVCENLHMGRRKQLGMNVRARAVRFVVRPLYVCEPRTVTRIVYFIPKVDIP